MDGVSTRRIEVPHYVPYMMLVDVDEPVVGKTAEQVRVELDNGSPRIWVGAEDCSLRVVVNCMSDEETAVVAERLREALGGGGR